MHAQVKAMEDRRAARSGSARSSDRSYDRSPAAMTARRDAKKSGRGAQQQSRAYALQLEAQDNDYNDYLEYQAAADAELMEEGDRADFGDDLADIDISANMFKVDFGAAQSYDGDWGDADDSS